MSTKITTIYDAMIVRLGVLLPNHKRLSNPYKLEENSEQFLDQGFGARIGPAENTNRTQCNIISIRRDFVIVITRKFFALEGDGEQKAVTEKDLMEDALLVIRDFETDPTMNGALSNSLYDSDTGVNYVFSGKDQFLSTEITISTEYFEQA